MNTDLIGIINIISGLTQIIIGSVAFLSDTKNSIKKYYFISALFLGLWSISLFFYANPFIIDTTSWLRIVYTFAYAMTLGLILFATVFPENQKTKFKEFFWAIFLLMIVCSYFLWFTDLIVVSTTLESLSYNTIAKMGPLYPLYALPEVITAFYIVSYYIKQSKIAIGIEKRQIQYYFIGGIIMLIPVFLFDFLLPMAFNNTLYYKYSTIGNVIWTILVGYSILKTRFLDIKVVIGTIAVYFTKAFIITIFFLAVFLIAKIANLDLSILTILKLLPIAFILGIFLTKLFSLTETFFSNKLVYTNYHPIKDLQTYNKSISQLLKLDLLTNHLSLTIKTLLHANPISILILDKKGNLISKSSTQEPFIKTDEIYSILKIWENLNSNRMLIYSEFKSSKRAGKRMIDNNRNTILDFLEKNSLEIMYPLDENETYTGVIVIGRKDDRSSYTINDIDFLESLIQSTQIALARAFLYFEVENFNKSLQQKVNEQTQELQIKVEQLQEARKKETDMIDIMGHELRTPATIVKLNSGFLTKFIDEIHSDPQGYKKYIQRIQDAIENEIKLINTLLNSAKLEGNKIELSPEKIDIVKEIDMAIHGNENDATKRNLRIINKTDNNTPNAYADKARLNEILNNLLSNAIKYTEQGGLLVQTSFDENKIKIAIADSGKGIPKDDISKLGQKFYRVSTYIESSKEEKNSIVRPGGTGLGLFVTFNLVKMMGGDIWVQSELGKGSVFTFTIPRYTNQHENKVIDHINMFERLGLRK